MSVRVCSGVLYIPPCAIFMNRLDQTRPWVVLLLILSLFGPRRGRRGVSERPRSRRWRLHETPPRLLRHDDHVWRKSFVRRHRRDSRRSRDDVGFPRRYYEYIYGEYRSNPELQSLYQKYPRTSSMFRSVDRVKLIMSILKCDPNENGTDSVSVSEVF